MKILLRNLTKRFPDRNKKTRGEITAVNDLTLEIPDGKLVGLLGPSGCGKSTTLNLICGLEKATEGTIFFGDRDVTALEPEHRGVGMVFQNYALYPHLTVRQNIQFPLENLKGKDKLTKEELKRRVDEAAELVQIDELMERRPSELSGGQQQRVAIARAISTRPPIIMADEPTGALDSKTGHEVLQFLQQLNKEGSTVILITHDNGIAATARRVVRIADGKIIEDHPQEVDWY